MSNIRYFNQSGPFWDFIANLEGQGPSHPMAAAYGGPSHQQAATNDDHNMDGHTQPDADHGAQDFPFGWGGPFGFGNFGPPFGQRGGFGGRGRGRGGGRGGHGRGSHGHRARSQSRSPSRHRSHSRHGNDGPGEGPSRRGPSPPPHERREHEGHGSGSESERNGHEHRHAGPHAHRGRHGHHGPAGHRGPPGPGGPHRGRRGSFGCGPGRHGGRDGPIGPNPFNLANLAEFFQAQLFGDEASRAQNHDANNNTTVDATTTKEANNGDFIPEVDVFDTESAFVIHASVPGAKKEDIAVTWDAEKSELALTGVVYRPGDEAFLTTLALDERKVGAFERKVRLGSRANPAVVDVDAISAKLEDGVLRVTVPKEDKDFVEIKMVDVQ